MTHAKEKVSEASAKHAVGVGWGFASQASKRKREAVDVF